MKARNLIQAIWPAILFLMWLPQIREGIIAGLELTALAGWLVCTLALHPRRRWSWRACLIAAGLSGLLGVAFFAGIAHMLIFPDHPYWADTNQPGAIMLVGGMFFLIPAALLSWHLFSIRGHFNEAANAK